jgi:hypothetical protein
MSLTLDDRITKQRLLKQIQDSISLKQEQKELEVFKFVNTET